MNVLKLPTKNDVGLNLVQSKFGLKGFAIAIKIMQEIVYSDGKYRWTEEIIAFMTKDEQCGASAGLIRQVAYYGVKVGLFDLSEGYLSIGKSSGRIGKLNKGD